MKNSKLTKRALFNSVMSSSLCVSMFIGTTFAWFTDSVETGVNKIQSGTLAIDLIHENGGAKGQDVSIKSHPKHTIFNYNKWEPGYTQVETLTIKNKGSLALQYELNATISGGTTGDNGEKLSDVIDVYMSFGENKVNSVEDLSNTEKWWNIGTLTEWLDEENLTSGKMLPKGADVVDLSQGITSESCTVTVALHMREGAGNEYQGLSLGDVKLILNAKQWTYEKDSINDDQYDADAAYAWDGEETREVTPVGDTYSVSHPAELAWIAEQVNVNGESFAGKTVKLAKDIDLANQLWTPIGQTGAGQFKGTFDGNEHTIFNLYIDSSEQSNTNYASGLFGWLNGGTVKNVTVDGANIVGSHYVGVIAGYMETSGATISNCHVINATITAPHIHDDLCGDKIGGIVGFAGNTGVIVKNSTVKNSTISAGRDAGQIAGAAKELNVKDCAAENVSVTAIPGCTGAHIRNELIGRVLQ